MKVGISPDEVGGVPKRVAGWLREPIAQGLLVSLALHLAIAVLFQPAPGSSVRHTSVINARLQLASSPVEPAPAQPAVATAAVAAQSQPPEALLTATTPSPAPVKENVVAPNVPPTLPVASTATAAVVRDVAPAAAQSAAPSRAGAQATGLPSLPLGIDTTWYSARQVDVHPKAIGLIEPAYPEEAKQREIEGTLRVMLKIDDLGRVQSAEVVEATPPGVFDEAALAAVRAARFQPAMKDGRPVRYQGYLRMGFKLKD